MGSQVSEKRRLCRRRFLNCLLRTAAMRSEKPSEPPPDMRSDRDSPPPLPSSSPPDLLAKDRKTGEREEKDIVIVLVRVVAGGDM